MHVFNRRLLSSMFFKLFYLSEVNSKCQTIQIKDHYSSNIKYGGHVVPRKRRLSL